MNNIKFYKVTGEGWNSPIYYASYSLENVKHTAYSDNNFQFILNFEFIFGYF